jgi:hypothetical protein
MLIMTDEKAVGVGGESRLSSSREIEEKGDIALVHSDIGGGMEGELTELHGLMHYGKDTPFFILPAY